MVRRIKTWSLYHPKGTKTIGTINWSTKIENLINLWTHLKAESWKYPKRSLNDMTMLMNWAHQHWTEHTTYELSTPTMNWSPRQWTEHTNNELSTPTMNWAHKQCTEHTNDELSTPTKSGCFNICTSRVLGSITRSVGCELTSTQWDSCAPDKTLHSIAQYLTLRE